MQLNYVAVGIAHEEELRASRQIDRLGDLKAKRIELSPHRVPIRELERHMCAAGVSLASPSADCRAPRRLMHSG